MKNLVITLAVILLCVIPLSDTYAQQINSNTSATVSNLEIIGPFPIGPAPKIEVYKWYVYGFSFIHTTTLTYWPNGKIRERSVVNETYNRYGLLTTRINQNYLYNMSGVLISPIHYSLETYTYNKDKRLTEERITNYYYDTRYRSLSSNYTVLTYAYTANGALARTTNKSYFYDARGKLVSSSQNSLTYTYNADGTLQEEASAYSECDASGALRAYSRSVKTYAYYENGDTYFTVSNFDKDGKLISKTATIELKGSNPKTYEVRYDVNANGEITSTHVYDQNGNEVTALGGEGYKQPSDIITGIYNPSEPYITIDVTGDITLNSNKTWDLGKYTINVTGTFAIGPDTNGYDIYVNGDMSIDSDKTIDLSAYSIYVNGNLSLSSREYIIFSSTLPIYVTGNLTIQAGTLGNSLPDNGSIGTGSTITMTSSSVGSLDEFSQRQNIENQVTQNNTLLTPQMAATQQGVLPIQKKE